MMTFLKVKHFITFEFINTRAVKRCGIISAKATCPSVSRIRYTCRILNSSAIRLQLTFPSSPN